MANEGSLSLPKMAADGQAQGGNGTETPALALPERQRRERLLGCCAEGSLESGSPAEASAQPAGEASPAAQSQQGGGPQAPGQCSSEKAAESQPSKKLKTEHPDLVQSKPGFLYEITPIAALVMAPPSDEDQSSEDSGDDAITQQQKGESIPETDSEEQEEEYNASRKPCAVKSSDAPSKTDSGEDVYTCEESSCESALSDGGSGDTDLPEKQMRLDSSTFLDEDSNQPMPMDRFFGDVELLQDLPGAALPSTTMSRREVRKLHFVAKEEEEEEDVV